MPSITWQKPTADALSGMLNPLRLYAGYDSDNKLIFVGDVVFVSTVKEDIDWKTEIKAGDGFRSFSPVDYQQELRNRNTNQGYC